METDCYQVTVLHYLNPHLIWVEVSDPINEFTFEQIGVYGVLPLDNTLDIVEGTVKTERSSGWAPAATALMKRLITDDADVWFRPTYIDRRSSIFDDNIHKYGELIINIKDKQRNLSQRLVKSGFAFEDVCQFHKELSLGNLNTKLQNNVIQDVIKHMEKHYMKDTLKKQYEKTIKKQTRVLRRAQKLESELTVANLKLYNKTTQLIMLKKLQDLEMCKDIDEESIGRGIRPKPKESQKKSIDSKLLQKKLNMIKKTEQKSEISELVDPIKRFLEAQARSGHNDDFLNEQVRIESVKHKAKDTFTESDLNELTADNNVVTCKQEPLETLEDSTENIPEKKLDSFKTEECDTSAVIKKILRKGNTKKNKVNNPQYDPLTEKCIAYGPPDIDRSSLKLFVVPNTISDDEVDIPVSYGADEDIPIKYDPFAGVDSEINIEITNKDVLKKYDQESKTEKDNNHGKKQSIEVSNIETVNKFPGLLQNKLRMSKEREVKKHDSSLTTESDTTNKDSSISNEEVKKTKKCKTKPVNDPDSDDESITDLIEKINVQYPPTRTEIDIPKEKLHCNQSVMKNNVNPFKNVDTNISVFVDKLVTPVVMVHTKMNKRIQPVSSIKDVNFNSHIKVILRNMSIEHPMTIQSVSWPIILKGYSLFMISPLNSGKTLGYLPAVCSLVSDVSDQPVDSVGPACIIVCATAKSVSEVEKMCKMFLGLKEKVVSCYAGMNERDVTMSLLNGCDLFICTPSALVRFLQKTDFGLDLRRLSTFVLDDCERLNQVYTNEVKLFLAKIKEMVKHRVNKEIKVQCIAVSRVWCDFMESLAKKAPNSVICISAFQECVLYSKTNTNIVIVEKQNKVNSVVAFLKEIDMSKRTVIVCKTDEEVNTLANELKKLKYAVFACDNSMTVQDLYNMNVQWHEYQEPVLGPILVCCDSNLNHMNVTDAHYLLHFSLPQLYSMFCKRFSVLNDNYATIFTKNNDSVKIKVLLENTSEEQLPKILNFVKRVTNVPEFLNVISNEILAKKDVVKAKKLVPICDNLLTVGECADFWNCQSRHAILKDYDEPKKWVPRNGTITFNIIHFHSAVCYSVKVLTNIVEGEITKYPPTYNTLAMKMSMYYGKEKNRRLHGIPVVGDICAVSINNSLVARCQVIKILSHYPNGNPNHVLIKLIDEEKIETSRDIYLYYLPDNLKSIETHVIQVRLANVQPKDKDVMFSDLAKQELKNIFDKGEYLMRGEISMTIGNCVFVDTLEACRDLSFDIVVTENFKEELLARHALPNPEHISKIEKLCRYGEISVKKEDIVNMSKPLIMLPKPCWAHLDHDFCSVYISAVENPGNFFVRLDKFENCMKSLHKDVQKYVNDGAEPVTAIKKGDLVLAKFPDDATYERARIDEIIDKNEVKCFFVDHGDWKKVSIKDLVTITEKFITCIPFQAIECRLVGTKPPGLDWTEYSTNWFSDIRYEGNTDFLKVFYIKYCTKESAQYTEGNKYGVVMVDTNDAEKDLIINQIMIDLNLARDEKEELKYLMELDTKRKQESVLNEDDTWEKVPQKLFENYESNTPSSNIITKKLIRSVPLVLSDEDSDEFEKWDVVTDGLLPMIQPMLEHVQKNELPAILTKNPHNDSLNQELLSQKVKELDSDDLSSPDNSQLQTPITMETVEDTATLKIIDEFRKPKLFWRQSKTLVVIKIQLIGVQEYEMSITEKSLSFFASANDVKYGFEFELYGAINDKKSSHINKGQYILVTLSKLLYRNWLSLTREGGNKKWIVYDVDSIDTSSDEDDRVPINIVPARAESDSEGEFLDDLDFKYKHNFDES